MCNPAEDTLKIPLTVYTVKEIREIGNPYSTLCKRLKDFFVGQSVRLSTSFDDKTKRKHIVVTPEDSDDRKSAPVMPIMDASLMMPVSANEYKEETEGNAYVIYAGGLENDVTLELVVQDKKNKNTVMAVLLQSTPNNLQ